MCIHICECNVHFRIQISGAWWVLAYPISWRAGHHRLLGGGSRCDKGRQSYIFWINVTICSGQNRLLGDQQMWQAAILSSNTKALLSSNHILCVDAEMCYVLEERPNVENQSSNVMLSCTLGCSFGDYLELLFCHFGNSKEKINI